MKFLKELSKFLLFVVIAIFAGVVTGQALGPGLWDNPSAASGTIVPSSPSYSVGSSSQKWKDAWFSGTVHSAGTATTGNQTITGNLAVTGTLGAGNTTITGTEHVTGATTLDSTLAAGNTTITGTEHVTGAVTIDGLLSANTTLASVDLTAQGAAINATTLYAVPVAKDGLYAVSWEAGTSRAATTSSVLGGATGLVATFTSADDSVVRTTNPTTPTISAINATGTTISGVIIVNAKASTNIQYAFGYTSVGGTTMQYNLHIKVRPLF